MWSYRPALDGLRTVAVYLVLLFHAGLPAFTGGFIGVDLFFVLSGFLVSQVVLAEIDRTGRLDLGGFYARRMRRLLPAAIVTVVATTAVFLVVATVVRRLPLVGDAQSALLYVANWHFLSQSGDYFAADLEPSPFLHFWSLAIEEQFYFVFPLLLVLLHRKARGAARRTAVVVTLLLGASVAAQVIWARIDANHAYYGTDARLYQLLAGVLLALAIRGDRPAPRVWPGRLLLLALLAGAAGLGVLGSGLLELEPTWRGLGATVAAVAMIAGATLVPGSWPARLLSRPIPVHLGKISYGTYLWHWPVILVLRELVDLGPVALAALTVPLATGLAAFSFAVLETPIRHSPRLRRLAWPTVGVGLSLSVLAALLVVPPMMQDPRRPALVARATADNPAPSTTTGADQPVPEIDWARVAADKGVEHTCPSYDVSACRLVDHPGGPHLLVVGDSQGEMFVPMLRQLAEERGFTLSVNLIGGCGWSTGVVNLKAGKAEQKRCQQAREGWYDAALATMRPDAVLLVQKPREGPTWESNVGSASGEQVSLPALMARSVSSTLEQLSALVPDVVVLDSVVVPNTLRVLDCLAVATTLGQCAVPVPRSGNLTDALYRAGAAAHDQVHTADLNAVICPEAEWCLPVRDGEVVWRDPQHLTTRFPLLHRDAIWAALRSSGGLVAFSG